MRVAILHDWLFVDGGAEQVLRALLKCYPEAEIFTVFDQLQPDLRKEMIGGRSTMSSPLNKLPGVSHYYRWLLPLYPWAVSRLNVAKFDLIVSSSYAAVKNITIRPGQVHLCYCHSPMRYAWDLRDTYLEEVPKLLRPLARWILDRLRRWDEKGARNVSAFAANSKYVANRIERAYNRTATVIYPPVNAPINLNHAYNPEQRPTEPYFITASRLVPYKNIDCIVRAFALRPSQTLVVLGDGPELQNLQKIATPNVIFKGFVTRSEWAHYLPGALAFIAAAVEDFGLTPVEASGAGIPVLALREGGYLETVIDGKSGLFFETPRAESIALCMDRFRDEGVAWDAAQCRAHAAKFRPDVFYRTFQEWAEFSMTEDSK